MDSYSKLLELVNTSGCFAPANHMYVTELRPDHSAVGVLEVQPSSLNPMGIVHGGALVTLADTVCGTAAFTTGHMCVTLDCSMQYLAPASGARITCTATPRKLFPWKCRGARAGPPGRGSRLRVPWGHKFV